MYALAEPSNLSPSKITLLGLNLRFKRKYLQTTHMGILPILMVCVNTDLDEERSKLSTESKEY